MDDRLREIEEKIHSLELRIQKVETRTDSACRDVEQIERNAGKAIWLVFASIITGVMAYILKGGLSGVGK